MSVYHCGAKFRMGRLILTTAAIGALTVDDVLEALTRHLDGDWGNLDEYDWQTNDEAVEDGGRILSEYFAVSGAKFWIVTECDRSATTILLPKEY